MLGFVTRRSQKAGLSPGTLVHIGERKTDKVRIRIIDYDEKQYEEKEVQTIEECLPFKDKTTVTWINIDGIHQVDIIEQIGAAFDLHPLILEDIVNTEQRPKIEDYGNYIFVVMKMLYHGKGEDDIEKEQVSIVLGSNFVISFQEREGDVFNPVRDRIRKLKGRIRINGPDYLTYALIDAVIDNYFIILERVGEVIEDTEAQLAVNPTMETLQSIHRLKKDMIFLRKMVWPLRELIGNLQRGEPALIQQPTTIYFKDIYDHTIQIIDTIESIRDMLSGMLDIYLSSISNKMNEVMKVLTIFAAIFIPLTFIAGVYGMNFSNMPELEWHWGYYGILVFMAGVGVTMLIYFKRKKWL